MGEILKTVYLFWVLDRRHYFLKAERDLVVGDTVLSAGDILFTGDVCEPYGGRCSGSFRPVFANQ